MNNMSKRFIQQPRKGKKRRPRTFHINENRGHVTDLNIDSLAEHILADYEQFATPWWCQREAYLVKVSKF